MELTSITIKNFKCFKERTFNFSGKFTLLIGDNGTGKTSILEALAVALGGFLAGLDGVKSRNILFDEVRRETKIEGDASLESNPQYPVEIICSAIIEDKNVSWKRTLNSSKGKTTHKDAKKITTYASELQKKIRSNTPSVMLPIIAYMGAGRNWSQKREKWEDPFEKEDVSRFLGYTDCLDAESNIKLFLRWFRKMQMIQIQRNKQIGEFNAVINAIKTFMKGLLDDDAEVNIYYDFISEEVVIEIDKESLPLRLMSAGYQSVIGMVAELAYRMAVLNPHLKDQAARLTSGVVLIDELDLHLHPKWQWLIVNDLRRTFPEVQFIATTHAPIIIASCADNELINLFEEDGDIKGKTVKTPRGWLVEDVLKDIMNTPIRHPETEKLIERVEELYFKKLTGQLTDSEYSELVKISEALKQNLPESDPAVAIAKLNAIDQDLFGK